MRNWSRHMWRRIKLKQKKNISKDLQRIICYLTSFERLERLTRKIYLQFQPYATKFLLQEGVLFRRSKPNMLPKRVIWDLEEHNRIISELHDKNRHMKVGRGLIPK